VKMLLDSTQRLSKLNKTLLLLSKIENQQFFDIENNDLKIFAEKILTYFEGQQENLQIKVSLESKNNALISANPSLLDVLLTNLIKNAFLHNTLGGTIEIKIEASTFTITNSSSLPDIPKDKLFHRFFKQSQNKESWGLGLAIVKKICDVNGWGLLYSTRDGSHTFSVKFR